MKKIREYFLCLFFFMSFCKCAFSQNKIVVFQSDFGLKDGAVSAMKGVAINVSADLKLFDLTHAIPAYNIWEAAYRLEQTVIVSSPRFRLVKRQVRLLHQAFRFNAAFRSKGYSDAGSDVGLAATEVERRADNVDDPQR